MVNRECFCWIEILQGGDFTFYPEESKINVKGRIKADVSVTGGNLDGSNQLFLTLNGDNASANFTIRQNLDQGYIPPWTRIYLEARELNPGILTVSNSRLAFVDIDLIWRGFQMLLQKNGNLFPVAKQAIMDTIAFSYPPVIKKLFSLVDWKMKYLAEQYLGFSFNVKFNVNQQEVDQVFDEFISYGLSEKYRGD